MTKSRKFLISLLDKNGFGLVFEKGTYSASAYSGCHGFELGPVDFSDEQMVGVFVMAMGDAMFKQE